MSHIPRYPGYVTDKGSLYHAMKNRRRAKFLRKYGDLTVREFLNRMDEDGVKVVLEADGAEAHE